MDTLSDSGKEKRLSSPAKTLVLGVAALGALILTSLYSYLLFHTLAEFLSIVVAMTYAVIAWHTRGKSTDGSIGSLGIAYFFVALLDLFHTLGYTGMGIFSGYGFPGNQLWVIARVLEATALLAFGFIDVRQRKQLRYLIASCSVFTILGMSSVFIFRIFPICFVAGKGQTAFKIAAEVFIVLILLGAALRIRTTRAAFRPEVYRYLLSSIALTIFSELCFMTYINNFDYINMAGHILKIASFWLVYRAIVVSCLERPNEMLYGKLNAALSELEAANKAKSEFIAILGHDLRNPLLGIRGVAQFLAEGDSLNNPQTSETPIKDIALMHKEIARSAGNALELLERVLAWARSQSGMLTPVLAELSASAIIAEAMAMIADRAKEKGVEVRTTVTQEATIRADREMLAAILRNLLSNAVKYSPRGGIVRIDARGYPRVETISISDEGIGLEEKEIAQLFGLERKISRLGTEGESGTGFGLPLCVEFAAKMGYTLSASSAVGKGSVFTLKLSSL